MNTVQTALVTSFLASTHYHRISPGAGQARPNPAALRATCLPRHRHNDWSCDRCIATTKELDLMLHCTCAPRSRTPCGNTLQLTGYIRVHSRNRLDAVEESNFSRGGLLHLGSEMYRLRYALSVVFCVSRCVEKSSRCVCKSGKLGQAKPSMVFS